MVTAAFLTGYHNLYENGKTLGSGSYATVVEATNTKDDKTYAIKIINKEGLTDDDEVDLFEEVDILQSLHHINIISLCAVYDESDAYYLVTELVRGGELFDRIILRSQYTEKDARDVSKILFEAIGYCHSLRIAHRDLKPENLLLLDETSDSEIKIADFGFAKRLTGPNCLKTQCGSPSYVAPEIIRGRMYDEKVDMWSIGVIIFVLLSGYLPFSGSDPESMYKRVVRGDYGFDDEDWLGVSDDARNMVTCLLQTDPTRRLSAEDALRHPWVTKDGKKLARVDRRDSLEKLKQFQAARKLQSAVAIVISLNNMSSAMRRRASTKNLETSIRNLNLM